MSVDKLPPVTGMPEGNGHWTAEVSRGLVTASAGTLARGMNWI